MRIRRSSKRSIVARALLPALVSFLLPVQGLRADTVVDITTAGSSGELDGAVFSSVEPHPTGSGVIRPFLRLQNKGTETGYNTDGELEFDTKGGTHTHSLQLSDVPVVEMNGVAYREFFLDINESKPRGLLSLDEMKIHLEDTGSLSGYPQNFSDPVYDLDATGDNHVLLDYNASGSGSGSGDMRALIPNSAFGTDDSKFLYLYSTFGQNASSDAGFEEWYVRGTDGNNNDPVPEPATLALVLLGGAPVIYRLQRNKQAKPAV